MLKLPSLLTPLEANVIATLLDSLGHDGELLLEQLVTSSLRSREHNGYGFYTNFEVRSDASLCDLGTKQIGASAVVGGELCGFLLWVKDGKADFLEGYPLGGDSWPASENFEQVKVNS